MRILLTGSSGWLGRFMAPALRSVGHSVTGLDVATGPDTDCVGSVADRALVDRLFAERGIEAVIHAGALHKPDIARYPAQAFEQVNLIGTRYLLEAATRAGCDRFVFTSTTSLMISERLKANAARLGRAAWLDEESAPLEPRNIYGATKLAAEQLCRRHHDEHGLPIVILRTGRFFPEEDDEAHALATDGPNTKANEFLHRRLTVEDAAAAHVAALEAAPALGFGLFIVSSLSPFREADAETLWDDAAAVIGQYFPAAPELYRRRGWTLPHRIDRVYDARLMLDRLGFRPRTGFADILGALARGSRLPFAHDPSYVSPQELARQGRGE